MKSLSMSLNVHFSLKVIMSYTAIINPKSDL